MVKTNKEKKAELLALVTDILGELDEMPKGIKMLVNQAAKQIPEDTIDETVNGILTFLAKAFIRLEGITDVPGEVALGPGAQADLNRSIVVL